jgi:hypothetical protein
MPLIIYIPTYHLEFHKTFGVLSSRFMFSVHINQSDGVVHFHYSSPLQDLSNGLSSDPNGHLMQY